MSGNLRTGHTTLEVRNVPSAVSRELKARAARSGMSLSEFVLAELIKSVARPSVAELRDRIARNEVVDLASAATVLSEARDLLDDAGPRCLGLRRVIGRRSRGRAAAAPTVYTPRGSAKVSGRHTES